MADLNKIPNPQICRSPVGGWCQTFINNTGTSVKGTLVVASSTVAYGVDIYTADAQSWARAKVIGVICESGVPNGQPVKVATMGKAYVLVQDNHAVNLGDVLTASPTPGNDGRAFPYDQPYTSSFESQIGRPLESCVAGVNQLVLMQIKFGA